MLIKSPRYASVAHHKSILPIGLTRTSTNNYGLFRLEFARTGLSEVVFSSNIAGRGVLRRKVESSSGLVVIDAMSRLLEFEARFQALTAPPCERIYAKANWDASNSGGSSHVEFVLGWMDRVLNSPCPSIQGYAPQ